MPKLDHWEKRDHSLLHDYHIYQVHADTWHHPHQNREATFYQMTLKDWAVALAKTPDDDYVLVEQFRFGSESLSLEFPAGVIDPGEDPITCAVRELQEETGYTAQNPKIIGWIHPNPALTTNKCFFIHLDNAQQTHPQNLDLNEEIHVSTKPLQIINQLAQNQQIHHGMVHAALFYLNFNYAYIR